MCIVFHFYLHYTQIKKIRQAFERNLIMDKNIQQKARRMRNAYARKWRAANKDKVRAAQKRYWMKKAQEAERSDLGGETNNKC